MAKKHEELTRTIAQFIIDTDASSIPPTIYEHAKVAFLDWFAVTIAGRNEPLVLKLLRFSDLMGGYEQATVLGHGLKKNVSLAALINGSASHALDYDDAIRVSMGHPSVVLFPSLLAFTEWKERQGIDFLTAYIIGLQVGACIGACAGLEHYMSGWHATATIGRIQAAAACAKLMGLDLQQTVYALGIAGTQAAGVKRVFGTMCKPFHAGKASQDGLEAALLASDGFTSAEDILEGPDGFFQLFKGQIHEEAVASLGKSWEIEKIVQKYHASCLATHSPIEAVLAITTREGLKVEDINTIDIHLSQMGMDNTGNPDPRTGLEAKFSTPYCVASALIRGETGLQAFTDEKMRDPEIREFMKKISLAVEQKYSFVEVKVELKTTSGAAHSAFYDSFKQIPELKTRTTKVKDKYIDLCGPVLGERKTKALMELILSLETSDNMERFFEQVHA